MDDEATSFEDFIWLEIELDDCNAVTDSEFLTVERRVLIEPAYLLDDVKALEDFIWFGVDDCNAATEGEKVFRLLDET